MWFRGRRRTVPTWAKAIALAVGYMLAAEVGNALSAQHVFSTFWPPSGLFLAVLLISQPQEWPLLIAGAVLGNVSSDLLHGRMLMVSLGYCVANSTEAVVGALLARAVLGKHPRLRHARRILVFFALSALLAPALGASIGATVVAYFTPGTRWLATWVTWWSGDVLGITLIVPLVLTAIDWFDRYRGASRERRRTMLFSYQQGTLVAIPAALLAVILFAGGSSPWKFALFALLLFGGSLGGPFAGTVVVMLVSTVGVAVTASVATLSLVTTNDFGSIVFQTQAFFTVAAFVSLVLSVSIDENRRLAEEAIAHEERVRAVNVRLERADRDLAEALGRGIEARDPYTEGHQRRVASLAALIATELDLDREAVREIEMAALLHDIGKLHVPLEILAKPGQLTGPEFALIMEHPQQGYDILKEVAFPWPIADVVLQHHERVDGSGYPLGLSGDAIGLPARILSVADVVEAMASHRPYRPALGLDVAVAWINENVASFDPDVVQACTRLYKQGRISL